MMSTSVKIKGLTIQYRTEYVSAMYTAAPQVSTTARRAIPAHSCDMVIVVLRVSVVEVPVTSSVNRVSESVSLFGL